MPRGRSSCAFLGQADLDLEAFQGLCSESTRVEEYALAAEVSENVLLYDASTLLTVAREPDGRRRAMGELARALEEGPGALVIRGSFSDLEVVDRTTLLFERILADERSNAEGRGDHFARPGANERIWNALQKCALRDPETFVDYYANPLIALTAEAWLGPGYQVTAQVNVVNPGGEAQQAHRDYHLGFQTDSMVERFPASVHLFSPRLTLQGAIAHAAMPLETGPTLLLPYSQRFPAGYLAWRRPEFRAVFDERRVQLPLDKGDLLFFSPALFHAAGENRTADRRRIANLLQISSALAKPMETIDHPAMMKAIYPALRGRRGRARGTEQARWAEPVIAAASDGYAFPTNLDRDPPVDGAAPESGEELMRRALAAGWDPEEFAAATDKLFARRRT